MELYMEHLQDLEDALTHIAFAQEYGRRHAKQRTEQQRQQRSIECAPDLRKNSINLPVGVPGSSVKERQTVLAKGRYRFRTDLEYQQNNQHHRQRSKDD